MKNPFEELQSGWKNSRREINTDQQKIDLLISRAADKRKSNKQFYYGNIFVLVMTLVVLIVVWRQWMPVQELLSRAGIGIMICSLALRIIIEVFSMLKARAIDLVDNASDANRDRISYYRFRKVVHGPVTISLVVAYLIGLFMILPELNLYISTWLIVVFTSAFIVSGLFIIYKVRQSIKDEMENLKFFISIDDSLHK